MLSEPRPGGTLRSRIVASDDSSMTASEMSAEIEARRAIRGLVQSLVSPNSYGLVLLFIIATYSLSIWLTRPWGAPIVVFVQIGCVWIVLNASHARQRLRVVASVVFVVAAATAIVSVFTRQDDDPMPLVYLMGALLYLAAPVAILRHIGFRHEVDRETMLGALAAYLLLGMAFALGYRFLADVQSGPFFGADGDGGIADQLFFSFITLTTTGYGNLVPAANPGQTMAVVEALVGQLFLITAVGKLVSVWDPRGWARPPSEHGSRPAGAATEDPDVHD
jgi:hypothetical protein